MDEFIQSFINESEELLSELERDLLELENNPNDKNLINNIFRVVHTLKGSAAMFGFVNIQNLSHEFESIYDKVRSDQLAISPELIDLTLQVKDILKDMLKNEHKEENVKLIKARLSKDFLENSDPKPEKYIPQNKTDISTTNKIFAIVFKPDEKIFERGINPENTLNELKTSGSTHIVIHEKGQPWEEQKESKICKAVWEIYLRTELPYEDVEFIFMFFDNDEYVIEQISGNIIEDENSPIIRALLEIYPDFENVQVQIEISINKLGPTTSNTGSNIKEEPKQPEQPNKDKNEEIVSPPLKISEPDSFINVSSSKIDELLNLVSELVTSSAVLHAHGERIMDEELVESIEHIEKLTKQFRNNALYLRLVPVKTLNPKFTRQIRDLSKELEKEVDFIFDDHDTEIDKSILDSIEKPLIHIIRNSLDHGIESPEERKKSNKNPVGLLKVSSFYSGANVIIQIQDDGRGINLDKVKETAIEKGYIKKDQNVTNQELLSIIMEPGFSTKNEVSLISGRGVGMDVVKKEIAEVKGSLEIETEKGLGTYITLKLPTTLSIIDTLLVDVMGTNYLLPLLEVEFCYNIEANKIFSNENQCIRYENDFIPFVPLREKFNKINEYDKEVVVVIINKYNNKYALVVDHVLGEYQAVIKNMGDLFINQPYFSGGNIMANGKIALIIDTNYIFNQVSQVKL